MAVDTPTVAREAERNQLAEGCCSAISPCSHQQHSPYTLCCWCEQVRTEAPSTAAHPPGSPPPGQAGEDDLAAFDAMLAALKNVNALVSEAALTGFNYGEGNWPEKLFHSQQQTSRAIRYAEAFRSGRLVSRTAAQAAPDGTGLECKNCGSRKDLKEIQAEGYRSCCPERDMAPLAAAPAAPAQGGGDGWQPVSDAPLNEEVEVRVGHMTFLAKLVPGGAIDTNESPCDQWQATQEGEHPPCWSDGACWSVNEDECVSLHPEAWRYPAPPSTEIEGR